MVGCGHVSGLLMRQVRPLALMLCADLVPIVSAHFWKCDDPNGFSRSPERPYLHYVVMPSPISVAGLSAYVRYVPCVDGSELARAFFTLQGWSVQPCVRPLGAVHMTAGHNALRGSGPGQNRAFKNAVAHVGCPDRRIDRLCITCCSPSQPSHHAGYPARSRYAASATGFLYRSPLAIIAQAMRASLLASAMAATLVGRRASSAVSQGRCLVPWILA